MEHDERAGRMERDADDLEGQSAKLEEHIEDARREWEGKKHDASVPGAQPEDDEQDAEEPPGAQPEDDEESRGSR